MVRRNWIRGVKRKRNKTYAERFIDRAMNDGEERTASQILDAILDYIDKSERKITYTFVPTKGKISSYISNNPNYILVKKATNRHSTIYNKREICDTCDGSGFKNHQNCNECNKEEEE